MRRVSLLGIGVALAACAGERPARSPEQDPTVLTAKTTPPAARTQATGEAPLPDACGQASRKLTRGGELADQGFDLRALRLYAQVEKLCPSQAGRARDDAARVREARASLAKENAANADTLWALARTARASHDLARSRRLASLATERFEGLGKGVRRTSGLADLGVLAISHDGARILARTPAGELLLVDGKTLEPKLALEDPPKDAGGSRATGGAFSKSGDKVAVRDERGVVVFDTASGARGRRFEWSDQEILVFTFTPDGSALLTGARGSFDAVVRRFDVKTGDSVAEYVVPRGYEVTALELTTDGASLAVATRGAPIEILDAAKLRKQRALSNRAGVEIEALAFSPNGQRLAAASHAGVEVWNSTTGASVTRAEVSHGFARTVLGFARDGSRIRVAGGTWGEALVEVDPADGHALASRGMPGRLQLLSGDGDTLVVGDERGSLAVVEAASSQVKAAARRPRVRFEALAAAEGHLALARELSSGVDSKVELFLEGARLPSARFVAVRGYKATLALSQLGQRLAGNFGGYGVLAWDVPSGKALAVRESSEWLDRITFSDLETLRASGGPFQPKIFSTRVGAPAWSVDYTGERDSRVAALSPWRAVLSTKSKYVSYDFERSKSEELELAKDVRGVVLSADGRFMFTASPRGLERFDLRKGGSPELLSTHCKDGALAASDDGAKVLVRCSYGELALVSKSGEVKLSAELDHVALSPAGRFIAIENDGVVSLFDSTGKLGVKLSFGGNEGSVVAESPDGGFEEFGASTDLADRAFCRVGNAFHPIELCEDRLFRDDLVRDAIAP